LDIRLILTIFGIAFMVSGCVLHKVPDRFLVNVDLLETFDDEGMSIVEGIPVYLKDTENPWYYEFGDEKLNSVIKSAFSNNLSLKQYWSILSQAKSTAGISEADKYPTITFNAGSSKSESVTNEVSQSFEKISAGFTSIWEIDIWNKISSAQSSAHHRYKASEDDVEQTAMLLAFEIVRNWYHLKENEVLERLLTNQLAVNNTFLELTNFQVSLGKGSALDVLQQKMQVAKIHAELPDVQQRRELAKNALSVLVGKPPGYFSTLVTGSNFKDLQPLPGSFPLTLLLERRPDLRAVHQRLKAADFDVAKAMAERLPSLNLSWDNQLSAGSVGDLLDNRLSTIGIDLLGPIFDANRRKINVDRHSSVVRQRYDEYINTFLTALREVEDALIVEKYQRQTLTLVDVQEMLAIRSLKEARFRYANGLVDYLSVLTALESLHEVQRAKVTVTSTLFLNRSSLYMALGGDWTNVLSTSESNYQRGLQ